MRTNDGAPGIDRITLDQVEQYGITRLLDEVADELREGRYRPLPARRVLIPKPGTDEQRPLSIPAVRDRIVQATVKIVVEPVFEADFLPCSFGFRPRRGQSGPDHAGWHPTGRGVMSPLLCNVYLNQMDRVWSTREHGGTDPLR